MAQWVKDLVLPQLWPRLQLQHRVDPWPRNFTMPQVRQKKKKDMFNIKDLEDIVNEWYPTNQK